MILDCAIYNNSSEPRNYLVAILGQKLYIVVSESGHTDPFYFMGEVSVQTRTSWANEYAKRNHNAVHSAFLPTVKTWLVFLQLSKRVNWSLFIH